MIGTISVRNVEALAPGEALWDRAVRGFGVRRQISQAVYVVKYRAGGRQRFYTIGAHGKWTPEQARREARRVLGLVATGVDPCDAKAQVASQAADTLRSVIDRYLAVAQTWQRPHTHSETRHYLLDSWSPLHRTSIFSIRRRDVAVRVAEIALASGAVSAARARSKLSALYNWAIAEGYEIAANPVAGTNRPVEPKPRDRVLTEAELRAVWRACGDDAYGSIVRLLLLTGQRRQEVGGMCWSEINTSVEISTSSASGDVWIIPAARCKNHREHTVPLSPMALRIIAAQPRQGDRVFAPLGWSAYKAALDARLAADGVTMPPFIIHDLRRTVATMLVDRLGVLPHIVEAILNHASGHRSGVAGIYNRARYSAEMRTALDRWALEVARIVRPQSVRLERVVG
jgi:integrase